jgi:hypothetical protein
MTKNELIREELMTRRRFLVETYSETDLYTVFSYLRHEFNAKLLEFKSKSGMPITELDIKFI